MTFPLMTNAMAWNIARDKGKVEDERKFLCHQRGKDSTIALVCRKEMQAPPSFKGSHGLNANEEGLL